MSDNFQLIPVSTSTINNQSTLTCDARELHVFLEVGRDFSNWIKDRIEKYGFTEGVDFILFAKSGEKLGHRHPATYTLTIDMAKQLAMVENNEKGLQVRRYFIECERIAKEAVRAVVPMTPTGREPKSLRERILYQLCKHGGTASLRDIYKNINDCSAGAAKNSLMKMRAEGLVSFRYPRTWTLIDRALPAGRDLPAPEAATFVCPYQHQHPAPHPLSAFLPKNAEIMTRAELKRFEAQGLIAQLKCEEANQAVKAFLAAVVTKIHALEDQCGPDFDLLLKATKSSNVYRDHEGMFRWIDHMITQSRAAMDLLFKIQAGVKAA